MAWRGGGFLLRGKSKKMICFPINATLKHAHMLLPGLTFEKKSPFCTQRCLTIEPPVGKVGNSTSSGHPIHQKNRNRNLGPFLIQSAPAAFPRTECPLRTLRRTATAAFAYLVRPSMRKAKVCGVIDTLVASQAGKRRLISRYCCPGQRRQVSD